MNSSASAVSPARNFLPPTRSATTMATLGVLWPLVVLVTSLVELPTKPQCLQYCTVFVLFTVLTIY